MPKIVKNTMNMEKTGNMLSSMKKRNSKDNTREAVNKVVLEVLKARDLAVPEIIQTFLNQCLVVVPPGDKEDTAPNSKDKISLLSCILI